VQTITADSGVPPQIDLPAQEGESGAPAQFSYFSASVEPKRISTDGATMVTITLRDLVLAEVPQLTVSTCPNTGAPNTVSEVQLSDVQLLDSQTLQATVPSGMSEGMYGLRLTGSTGDALSLINDFGIMRPADGQPGSWRIATALRSPGRYAFATIAAAGRLYIVGGDQAEPMVESAPILADGSLGAWQDEPALNTPRRDFALVAAGDYLYAIGGTHPRGFTALASVERAPLLSGGIGPWETISELPAPRSSILAVVVRNRVYALGGITSDDLHNSAFAADILPNGDLGPWESVIPPVVREQSIATVAGDFIYLLGGVDGTVQRSRVRADGFLEAWEPLRSSLRSHSAGGAAVIGDTLYLIGGFYGCIYGSNFVERTTINPDGSLGPWEPVGSSYFGHGDGGVTVWNDTLYAVGGLSGFGSSFSGVEYARFGAPAPNQNLTPQIWLPQLWR
ncbi:MAG: hypothetical protein HC822_18645, partial [Oscillochloris sp.]|nr:hypothetical protein [Oscillochloris sp.]